MRINYNVRVPKTISKFEDLEKIIEFANGTERNMSIEYDTLEEALKRRNSIQKVCERMNLDIYFVRRKNILFVIRTGNED